MPRLQRHGVAPITICGSSRLLFPFNRPILNFPRTAIPMAFDSSRAACVSAPSRIASDAGQPRDGDVIVSRESGAGGKYTLRQVPGDVQLHASVRDEAIRLARAFAVKAAVDLWSTDDGRHRLLEAHRKESNS